MSVTTRWKGRLPQLNDVCLKSSEEKTASPPSRGSWHTPTSPSFASPGWPSRIVPAETITCSEWSSGTVPGAMAPSSRTIRRGRHHFLCHIHRRRSFQYSSGGCKDTWSRPAEELAAGMSGSTHIPEMSLSTRKGHSSHKNCESSIADAGGGALTIIAQSLPELEASLSLIELISRSAIGTSEHGHTPFAHEHERCSGCSASRDKPTPCLTWRFP
mmetsp:Transcript_5574/g.12286  ORF Transcript_5574/g.12286 Transcript_5574/m.12286 type:complete len:215 (+) Transcript_5574:220-864(+)